MVSCIRTVNPEVTGGKCIRTVEMPLSFSDKEDKASELSVNSFIRTYDVTIFRMTN